MGSRGIARRAMFRQRGWVSIIILIAVGDFDMDGERIKALNEGLVVFCDDPGLLSFRAAASFRKARQRARGLWNVRPRGLPNPSDNRHDGPFEITGEDYP